MPTRFDPFQFLLTSIAGWMNQWAQPIARCRIEADLNVCNNSHCIDQLSKPDSSDRLRFAGPLFSEFWTMACG
jgi:hypothetical protein